MPESSDSNDSLPSSYRSRMSSLGLEDTPQKHSPKRGQHVFVGIVVGVLIYLVLAVLLNVLIGGIVASVLLLVDLAVSVVVGIKVYRILQRREARVGEVENIGEATSSN